MAKSFPLNMVKGGSCGMKIKDPEGTGGGIRTRSKQTWEELLAKAKSREHQNANTTRLK